MLVSHRYRFIFQKVHKTAGTSVEILLEPYCCEPELYPGPAHYRPALETADGIIGRRGPAPDDGTDLWYNHMPAAAVRQQLGEATWKACYKFCVARNPFDKAVSWFWFRMKPRRREALTGAPFAEVRQAFRDRMREPAFPPGDAEIYLIDNRFALDGWLRYEHLEADIAALIERLRLPPPPHAIGRYKGEHRRRPEPWQAYFDTATRDKVLQVYGHECLIFGYDPTW